MTNFWKSGTGAEVTGDPKKAFLPDFSIIPDNTYALAKIEIFEFVSKVSTYDQSVQQYYEITWKITDGDFINRVVSQKIKVFDGKPEAIDRNLNMMKLIMDLCNFKPKHADAPNTNDLMPMVGKILGIKIREYSVPKKDGTGMLTGNNVSEVHPTTGFKPATGVKLEVVHTANGVDSALTRNPRGADNLAIDDIPF